MAAWCNLLLLVFCLFLKYQRFESCTAVCSLDEDLAFLKKKKNAEANLEPLQHLKQS